MSDKSKITYKGIDLGFGTSYSVGTPISHDDAADAFAYAIANTPTKRWIGKNNLLGRLRYWYYEKRGWVYKGVCLKPPMRWRRWLATKLLHVMTDEALKQEFLKRGYSEMTITTMQDNQRVEYKAIVLKEKHNV